MTERSEVKAAASGPPNGQIVLLSLILVAAVANLNLAVANVALPVIGARVRLVADELDLVAVGYSLGLAASVLWLGALGDRYGRKLMLMLGIALSIPACLLAAFAPTDRRPVRAPASRRPRRGHGLPDDAGADHRAVVRARPGPSRSRCGRRSAGRSPPSARSSSGFLLEHFCWGSVFLVTLPLAVVALVHGHRARAGARQRDDRAGRQPRRHPVGRAGRRADPGDQLRAGPERGRARRSASRVDRASPRRRLRTSASAARRTRSTTSHIAARASSGSRRAPGSSCSAR